MKIDTEDLDMLADLECAEDGPLVVDGEPIFSEWEVDQDAINTAIVDNICPLCGEELGQTLEASLDMLKMIAERFPHLGDEIAQKLDEAVGPSASQECGGDAPGGEGLSRDTSAIDGSPNQTVS